jgi:hypothetical protein
MHNAHVETSADVLKFVECSGCAQKRHTAERA